MKCGCDLSGSDRHAVVECEVESHPRVAAGCQAKNTFSPWRNGVKQARPGRQWEPPPPWLARQGCAVMGRCVGKSRQSGQSSAPFSRSLYLNTLAQSTPGLRFVVRFFH